jgi:hypothetical protein
MHDALDVGSDRDAALVRFAETVSPTEAAVLRDALDGTLRTPRARRP